MGITWFYIHGRAIMAPVLLQYKLDDIVYSISHSKFSDKPCIAYDQELRGVDWLEKCSK
jgi:hypothetical protein